MDAYKTSFGVYDIRFQSPRWTGSDAPIAVAAEIFLERFIGFDVSVGQDVPES